MHMSLVRRLWLGGMAKVVRALWHEMQSALPANGCVIGGAPGRGVGGSGVANGARVAITPGSRAAGVAASPASRAGNAVGNADGESASPSQADSARQSQSHHNRFNPPAMSARQ